MLSTIKIALRNLLSSGYYTLINVVGLTIGIASFLLILVYVWDEWNYDRHHKNAEQIFRVVNVYNENGVGEESSGSPFPLGPAMMNAYPELINNYTRIFNFQREKHLIQVDSALHEEEKIYFADTSFFSLFNYTFVSGDPEQAFKKKNSIILTESKAFEFFGHNQAIGKSIRYQEELMLQVTGIIKDPPARSHFIFDGLITFPSLEQFYGEEMKKTGWVWNPCWTYLLLDEGVEPKVLENKLPEFVSHHFTEENRDIITLYLQSLVDIHLKSNLDYEIAENSNYRNITTLFFVAIIILLAAIINFINLTTANSVKRIKEISIKKISGATNTNVLTQFLLESTIISLVALVISLAIAEWILPHYSLFTGKDLRGLNISSGMILFVFGVGLLTGLLAGIYPALQLSGFKPLTLLSRRNTIGNFRAFPRKILVTFQFIVSLVLIILSVGLLKQYRFLTSVNLGFDSTNTIIINTDNSKMAYYYDEIRDSLLKNKNIINVTSFNYVPGVEHNLHPYIPEGKDTERFRFFPAIYVRSGFFETYNIDFLAGKPYGKTNEDGIIINKAMVDYLGWGSPEEALGKAFSFENWNKKVIGVTDNFNVTSLHDTIVPFVVDMHSNEKYLTYFSKFMAVKHQADKGEEVVSILKDYWNNLHPDRTFNFSYHNDILANLYSSERILSILIIIFTLISLFVSILGMMGLTSSLTKQREREVAIRKFSGAQTKDIVILLLREYSPLLILAFVFSWPLVIYIMNLIMKDIAYRVSFGPGMLIFPTLAGITIIVITIIIQSYKTSNSNPADILRDE